MQNERANLRPMGEDGLRGKVGRRRLIVTGAVIEDEGNRSCAGAVVAAQSDDSTCDRATDADAFAFVRPIGNLFQRLVELAIQRALKRRIECYEDVMGRFCRRRILRRVR